ncbi:MAG: lpxC [Rickettsiales bacterium]|nr:lpxC [Rickettsiales bacterium]
MPHIYQPFQRTLANNVSCTGVGLHTGQNLSMTLKPAPEDTGICFIRTDIKGKPNEIRASYENVTGTQLGTNLTNIAGVQVGTVEHLMAALWGCDIDNCYVEVDGPEVPVMDGSSEPFVFLVECAGVKVQAKTRQVVEVLKVVTLEENGCRASISPHDAFCISLEIDFASKAIARQTCVFDVRDSSFKTDLSRARTFGFIQEVEKLREMGLARGGSLDNAIVIDGDTVMNEEGLRFNDEFVRHKVLDCIGDVYLAGSHIQGHIEGYRSGHAINNKLLRKLFADETAWRVKRLPEASAASAN